MRKRILIGMAILAVIAIATFNVNLSLKQESSKMSPLALANLEALTQNESGSGSGSGNVYACDPGGPGASSCTISRTYPTGAGVSKSITCIDGYYACCTKDTWGDLSAFCVPY